MTKPLKHRIGYWLLISLIPAAILLVLSFIIIALESDDSNVGGAIGALVVLYGVVAIPAGATLLMWGNIEFNRAYRASMQYGERNGWRPISRTSWRNRKRDNAALSVSQAFKKRTFLLQIEVQSETITIDEFETSLWAMQFGDWLWRELLIDNAAPDREDIEEKRAEWETTALVPSNR